MRYRLELHIPVGSARYYLHRETDVKRVTACNQRHITYPRHVKIARDPARCRARI